MERFENIENKDGFYVHFNLPDVDAATSTNYYVGHTVMKVPCDILHWAVRWGVASTSGTVSLEKVKSGTAKGSGIVFSNAQSTAGTANTPVEGTLLNSKTNGIYDRRLMIGDALAIKAGGTLTNLKDLQVTVYLKPIGKGDYR